MTALDTFARREVWVSWNIVKRGDRPTKVPFAVDGKPAKADDPSTWMTRAQAVKAAGENQHQGIGIMLAALDNGQHLGGIDLDACIDDDGHVMPWGREILDLVPSYTEISPSGRGLKIYFLHNANETLAAAEHWRRGVRRRATNGGKDHGIEMYLAWRYFAVTDRTFEDRDEVKLVTLDRLQAVHEKMEAFQPRPKLKPRPASDHPRRHDGDAARLLDAIDHIPNHDLHWEEWNRIGMAIYAATGGGVEGHAAFERFSARSSLHDAAATEERWNNYRRSPPKQLSAGTIFHEARLAGWREPERAKGNGPDVPPPADEGDYGSVKGQQQPGGTDHYTDSSGSSGSTRPGSAKTNCAGPGSGNLGRFAGMSRVLTVEDLAPLKQPPRPWLMGTTLMLGYATGVVGAGGIGKSTLILMLLVAIVTNDEDILGEPIHQSGPCWYITGDDDIAEVLRQIAAIVMYFEIDPAQIAGRLIVTSTVGTKQIHLAATGQDEESPRELLETELVDSVIDFIRANNVLVTAFDPFVDFAKGLREIDNEMMNTMGRIFAKIAQLTGTATLIAEHIAKSSDDPTALYFARGGTGFANKLRITIHLAAMTEDQAEGLGVSPHEAPYWLGRYDGKDKFKVRTAIASHWYQRESVALGQGDSLGVLVRRSLTQQPDITHAKASEALDEIAKRFQLGPDKAFTLAPNSPQRSLTKYLVKRLKLTKGGAQRVIDDWDANGIIEEVKMGRAKNGGYPTGVKVLKRP